MSKVSVEFDKVAALGSEHIANTVVRIGIDGLKFTCWGERVVEWPVAVTTAAQGREVVAPIKGNRYSNGGCAMDVDGDGIEEVVVVRNDGKVNHILWLDEVAGESQWREYEIGSYEGGRPAAPHDIVPFSVQLGAGKEAKGVVAILNRRELVWFEIPSDPKHAWVRHSIANLHAETNNRQSGLAVGDIAGNGRPDVACGMFWAECPTDPINEVWRVHRYGSFDENGWGGMTKLAIADIDSDGASEIIASEAEIPDARIGIFKRVSTNLDALWRVDLLDTSLYAPHSVIVADLTGNGRLDVVVGEMEAGGWSFPKNPNPKVMVYISCGGMHFDKQILHEGQGIHEMRLLSLGDKKILYGCDEIQPQKFDDQQTDLVFWQV